MRKSLLIIIPILFLAWCGTQLLLLELPEVIHRVDEKVVDFIGTYGLFDRDNTTNNGLYSNNLLSTYCQKTWDNSIYSGVFAYECKHIPLYFHSYEVPSLNLVAYAYERSHTTHDNTTYPIDKNTAPFYLTTGDHHTFVVSGNMLIDMFIDERAKDPLWFNEYEIYLEKIHFLSGQHKDDIINNLWSEEFSWYVYQPESLITGNQDYMRYDKNWNYDIYMLSYKIDPQREVFPLMSVTYIFSPHQKNYYYREIRKVDGFIWPATQITKFRFFTEDIDNRTWIVSWKQIISSADPYPGYNDGGELLSWSFFWSGNYSILSLFDGILNYDNIFTLKINGSEYNHWDYSANQNLLSWTYNEIWYITKSNRQWHNTINIQKPISFWSYMIGEDASDKEKCSVFPTEWWLIIKEPIRYENNGQIYYGIEEEFRWIQRNNYQITLCFIKDDIVYHIVIGNSDWYKTDIKNSLKFL